VRHLEKLEKEGKTKIYETTFKSEKDFKDMIDTLLGYDKKFFMDVEEFNAPFGIKDATSLSTFKKHQTKFSPIEKELETAKIYLRNSKYGSQYKFEGTIYTPPLKLPKKYEKMRIKTALFDLIFSPDQGQLKFDTEDPFDNDKKVKFKELYSFIKFFQGANEASNTYLRLESSNPKTQPVELCLGLQSISCSKDIKIMFKIIEATYKRLSDLNLENEFISTQSILENLSNFQLFDLVNKEYKPNFELPFNSNFDGDPSICNVVLFSSTIKLINIQLVSYFAFFGTIEKLNDSKFIGKFYKSEYLGDFYQDYSSDIKDAIEKESIHFENGLRDRGFIVFT